MTHQMTQTTGAVMAEEDLRKWGVSEHETRKRDIARCKGDPNFSLRDAQDAAEARRRAAGLSRLQAQRAVSAAARQARAAITKALGSDNTPTNEAAAQ